ncbi:MAG: hypothetical protein J1F36_01925 [Clostridiales bacterium]|nr:hypothetical protein [Clostridiales bacterium]
MVCEKFLTPTCLSTCKSKNSCIASIDNRKSVVCAEKHKKYQLENQRRVVICNYHIDGGVIKDSSEKKCDYLILVPDTKYVVLVELKGCKIITAVEQIENTLALFKEKLYHHKIFARIICQQVPQMHNIPEINALKKLLKLAGGNLDIKAKLLCEKETELTNQK